MILRVIVDPEVIAREVNEVVGRAIWSFLLGSTADRDDVDALLRQRSEEGDVGETSESVTRWIEDNPESLGSLLQQAIVDAMSD